MKGTLSRGGAIALAILGDALHLSAMHPINLAEKLGRFTEHWSPKIIAELNGQHVKLVKIKGEFVWHHHAHEDELFHVVRGWFRMDFRERPINLRPSHPSQNVQNLTDATYDRSVVLREGEMIVVPRGVEHRPVAEEECSPLLFEPVSTVNTGSAGGERTVAQPDRI